MNNLHQCVWNFEAFLSYKFYFKDFFFYFCASLFYEKVIENLSFCFFHNFDTLKNIFYQIFKNTGENYSRTGARVKGRNTGQTRKNTGSGQPT